MGYHGKSEGYEAKIISELATNQEDHIAPQVRATSHSHVDRLPLTTLDHRILRLPPEIRLHFYTLWLNSFHNTDLDDFTDWPYDLPDYPRHELKGFYRPWRATYEERRVRDYGGCPIEWEDTFVEKDEIPELWGVSNALRMDATSFMLGERVLLEMDGDKWALEPDPRTLLEAWEKSMDEASLKMIRKLHVIVDCSCIAKGHLATLVRDNSNEHAWRQMEYSCQCSPISL